MKKLRRTNKKERNRRLCMYQVPLIKIKEYYHYLETNFSILTNNFSKQRKDCAINPNFQACDKAVLFAFHRFIQSMYKRAENRYIHLYRRRTELRWLLNDINSAFIAFTSPKKNITIMKRATKVHQS